MVVNGAGAASIACIELVKAMGLPHENAILCDTKGVHLAGPHRGHEPVEERPRRAHQGAHARGGDEGRRRLLRPVGQGRGDQGRWCSRWPTSRSSSPWPIPIPRSRRRTCARCAATPSSPPAAATIANQINNVLGFPYIFRGALDVRARTINEEMKVAAAEALAKLAREDVPDEVDRAYSGRRLRYGPEYIVPVPFDPRLISAVSSAVAQAAMDSGVARRQIADMAEYRRALVRPPRPDQPLAAEPVRAGQGQPAAHRLRRGRGGAHHPRRRGVPRQRLRHAGADRPRGAGARDHEGAGHHRHDGPGDPQCAALDAQRALHRPGLQAPAARRLPAPRRAAHGQPGPQRVRRLHGGDGRRRRHGDRHHAPLPRMLRRHQAGDRRASPARCRSAIPSSWRATARCSWPTPRSTRRRRPSSSPPSPSRWSATPAPWATSRASPSSPSPTSAAARSSASTASARRSGSWTPRRSISSMTARCRPTWRSTTSCCARPIRSAA